MYIKSLTIAEDNKVIREIAFHNGINLIVDETDDVETTNSPVTGNNVGKTTVLRLIDFCLGASPKGIYVDPDDVKNEYALVKNYLIGRRVVISLVLKEDLDVEASREIKIERNFLSRNKIVRKINGQEHIEDEFEPKLLKLLFPTKSGGKPTFRQIVSHNIRYKDSSINSTLKTLDKFTSNAEYETLYLFMLGVNFFKGNEKQNILEKLKQEESFKRRLEKPYTKTAYEASLGLIDRDIVVLNKQKANFNINQNLESDIDTLNTLKYSINKTSSELSSLKIKRSLIEEAEKDFEEKTSNIDIQQLQAIYQQATSKIIGIQKSFEDLVVYHNQMITEKVRYITKELPVIDKSVDSKIQKLRQLIQDESALTARISESETFEELEKVIVELNEKYRKKGEYENIIKQIKVVEGEMESLESSLKEINDHLFSKESEENVKTQLAKFNTYFSNISNTLYGEQYALKYDIAVEKGKRLYKFSAFNVNMSSGKKQGEISCFDIAYILFADAERIPNLHFLLNDKKELMHDNQLLRIAELVSLKKIQFVASILKDKLPASLNKEENFIVKLSQKDKLFRIETPQD